VKDRSANLATLRCHGAIIGKLFVCLQVIQDFVADLSKHIEDIDRSVVCVVLSVACCVAIAEEVVK